jgi:hypothetical protein
MKKRTRFEYKQRDPKAAQKRANQSGGLYDSPFKSDFTSWKPKEGENRIRFLPPTWEDAEHYGLDVYVHYGIGSDDQAYLCAAKMKGEACPICDERKRAQKDGDDQYAKDLAPVKRVLVWVIDRNDEDAGPQLWSMAWSIDAEIASLSIDKRSGETLFIDNPEDGYDIEISRKGTKLRTKYSGTKIDRKPSPLADDQDTADEWLKMVQENPLTDVLVYFDPEHIAAVAAGRKAKDEDEDEDDDEEEDGGRFKGKSREAAADARKKRRPDDDDEDEDEDDDEEPRKKSKAKRRPEPEEDDEEDDEDDEPRPTRREKVTTKKKTISRSDDDEDEDDEEEYDCPACEDTGRSSKGGFCVCKRGKKMKLRAADKIVKLRAEEDDDEDEDD